MNDKLLAGMLEATRLTRAGRLQEATATIQRTLGGAHGPEAQAAENDDDTILEGRCRVIPPDRLAPPSRTHAPPRDRHQSPFHARPRTRPQPRTSPQTRAFNQSRAFQQQPNVQQPPAFRKPGFWSRPGTRQPTREVLPPGARFLAESYTNQAGTRPYKLYIPSCYRDQALPLVVMLHGCTQDPDDFAAGTRMNQFAERHACLVAYPAQTQAANMSRCWNWFRESDQSREQGEPSIIAGITRHISATYTVDARRIHVAGLSAGGSMASIMAQAYPDLYAAACIHSGPDHSAAHDLPSAFAAMQGAGSFSPDHQGRKAQPCTRVVPTIVFHGDSDFTVRPGNGDQVADQWHTTNPPGRKHAQAGPKPRASIQRGQVPDGRAYTRTSYRVEKGQTVLEHWLIHGAGHAWSGGSANGSYTDPKGPDATQEMLRFFQEHPRQTRPPGSC